MDDTTLGGYQQVHGRPPAFGAADGQAYSVATFADTPDEALAPVLALTLEQVKAHLDACVIRAAH
ncbi:MAG: hypothetical protein DMD48_02655 [Gemmatimonadetes bacterium]|nr:MAG: hypothetical protein DMD48_02655 [Gemmatimonadota bacterium]